MESTDRILEPSAGRGALIKAVLEEWPDQTVDCYELMEENRAELAKIPNARLLGNDFMEAEVGMYDKIISLTKSPERKAEAEANREIVQNAAYSK